MNTNSSSLPELLSKVRVSEQVLAASQTITDNADSASRDYIAAVNETVRTQFKAQSSRKQEAAGMFRRFFGRFLGLSAKNTQPL
jgi:hypothetical protein